MTTVNSIHYSSVKANQAPNPTELLAKANPR